ncbi:MAG TPA: hypothetical protein VE442_18940 [Jatrophihabitans sp.]|nr:hypothetical protein [Jatrophihabitans sp.]
MQSAQIETARVVGGAIGGVVVAVAVAILTMQAIRWWQQRRRGRSAPGTPALARFVDSESTDELTFGGGAWSARVRRRRDTVTYGYLAVAEEHVSPDTGGCWCTLTVTLPGRVPLVVIDNRAAAGRVGVPMGVPHRAMLDDPPFDATYVMGAADVESIGRVLCPAAREVLLRAPVQRLLLHDSQLLLRTFDGVTLSDQVIAGLDGIAARFLASTPSFVTAPKAPVRSPGWLPEITEPLPEGFYGPTPTPAD